MMILNSEGKLFLAVPKYSTVKDYDPVREKPDYEDS